MCSLSLNLTEKIYSVSNGVWISLFQCLKFITDDGVDVYALIYEVNYILGLPPLPTTYIPHMGVGIYGLIDDVIAVLPIDDLKVLIDIKIETREYLKTLVTHIHSPVIVVSIHFVYLNFVSCCLCYVQTFVWIIVMNALLLLTEIGGNSASLARIWETSRDTTKNRFWFVSYHWTP